MRAKWLQIVVVLAALFLFLEPPAAHAYIGPGAGFAFVSSFFVIFVTFLLAFVTLLTWPIRRLIRSFRGRKALKKSRVQRVVIVGLDGQDPELTDKFLAEGLLPNFKRLQERGSYVRLETSFPAESPVAWSCFQTGANPGKHNVYDFLVPNRKSYLPELSSAKVSSNPKTLSLGKYRIPLGKPAIDLGRKSQPFWKVLGNHGVFSSILRVPITFPPEKFYGTVLSAMMVPDLKGSQGTFSYYSTDEAEHEAFTGGQLLPVDRQNGTISSTIVGPDNSMVAQGGDMTIPFQVKKGKNGHDAELVIDGKVHPLELRKYTDWIDLNFKPGLGIKVKGISRFYLKELEPHFKLYMSPVNIDPDKPALPISHPFTYAMYLSKTQGRYTTLGLAEDTWSLNERVLDEEAWLQHAWTIHDERERMFFDALEKTKRGTVACVFDITDRLQHMFFRYLEDDHPANPGKDTTEHKDAIRDLYKRMDDLVGRVLDKTRDDDIVMVMSDHGFKTFRRGINLNTWLHEQGLLKMKDDVAPDDKEWFDGVDWSRTKAYAVGLGGMYLNLKGREAKGIVEPGEEEKALKAEIQEKLKALKDPADGSAAIAEVYDGHVIYKGPYVRQAPDLLVGFNVGYRTSWSNATGGVAKEVFEDNVKSWSGDHCMNPPDVPGIFFCNQQLKVPKVNIMDIGPTVLDLFGVPVPKYCDGKPFMQDHNR